MNYKDVEARQEAILKSIYDCGEQPETSKIGGILEDVRRFSDYTVQAALGDFGLLLKNFSTQIDLSHPDLRNLFDGQLDSGAEGSFNMDAKALLKLGVYAFQQGIPQNVTDYLKKLLSKADYFKTIGPCIDSPFDNCLHVRFVPERSGRDRIRLSKRMQTISLSSLYKKGAKFWGQQPDAFDWYVRNNNRFERDIREAEERIRHFSEFGLTSMVEAIKKTVGELTLKAKGEMYYGFNRISLVTASVILGKMMRFEFVETYKPMYSLPECIAFADRDMFEWKFSAEDRYEKWEYLPRAYTYEEYERFAPESMVKLVDFLEAFPETGGKPLFDHYRVLVPSFNYPNIFRPDAAYKDTFGELVTFRTAEEAQRMLELTLLREKHTVAVLLGERDGDHYFISYFV